MCINFVADGVADVSKETPVVPAVAHGVATVSKETPVVPAVAHAVAEVSEELPEIPAVAPKKRRFARVESHEDVVKLAQERNCSSTQAQTRWAVKVFTGESLLNIWHCHRCQPL